MTLLSTFGPACATQDVPRIMRQMDIIRELMIDGMWRTLADIEQATGYPQASISAQLRHLKKERFGKYQVKKKRRRTVDWNNGTWRILNNNGTWEYRLLPPVDDGQKEIF